jgi:hypothetical protein
VEPAACRGAARRNDRRVIARNMATARAPRPATSAISEPTGEPPESAETLATGLAPSACAEPGATVGNKLAALPPGLTVGVRAATPGGGRDDSDDKLVPGGLDALIEAAAAGSLTRPAALPVTVRPTVVTVVARSGTVTSASNCRCAELASTAPRSHADVPLPLPQPKVKVGVPAPAVDCSWILASGTLPPTVQAPTTHCDACPRTLLCCRGITPTHRLTGVPVAAAAWNAVKTMAWPGASAAGAPTVGVSVGVGADVVGAEVVGAEVVGAEVVGAEVVGAEVVGAEVVGAEVVGAEVVGADVVGAEVAGTEVVGVGVAFVGDALGDALADCMGSQDSLLPVAVAAAALPVMAATAPPEAAVSRALPAIKVTARRRPCAIPIPNQSMLIDIIVK